VQKREIEQTKSLAKQGDANAQYILGLMYDNGKGVPQDYKEAVKWYRISAEQGEAMAQSILAVMYMNGKGVPQDYKKAYAWTSVGKAFDEELAEEHLGVIKKKMTKEQIAEAESLFTEIQNRIEANRKE
jgi:TPR repeat protein